MSSWRFASHIAWQKTGNEAVVIDLENGLGIGLNECGAFVLERLEQSPLVTIAHDLAGAWSISHDEATRHVESFISDLAARQLILRDD